MEGVALFDQDPAPLRSICCT